MILALITMLGIVLIVAVSNRRDTTDARQFFGDLVAAHDYIEQQDAAGFDCFITRMHTGYEVRCYRRAA